MRRTAWLACLMMCLSVAGTAQETKTFTHADTLLGAINSPQRAWWDVTFYDLHVSIHPADSSISGYNGITYKILKPAQAIAQAMQIDLMTPLEVDSMVQDGRHVQYRRDGNAFFVTLVAPQPIGSHKTITVYYHGRPRIAKKPPWDGGFVWARDSSGNLWVSVACEEMGASVWWPNKDTQADEPDSQRVAITVPDPMIDVSNGRLRSTTHNHDGTTTYEWFVQNPINNYDVSVNAGTYSHFSDVYHGLNGDLTLDFWPLTEHLTVAKSEFTQVKPMLACFENWFGPFPWYKDGYKLVEAPYLGMEHQSSVEYGNHYQNGYLGRDLSHTGWGMKWDFIIVHESGHEWFGNNITAQDHADLWIHESFTNYSEGLYTECQYGKDAGAAYIIGMRKNIQNDEPIIAPYGVHREGSGDMYYKGANMLHTMRQVVNNDTKWRDILRGLNSTFWHQTVTAQQIEDYMSKESGVDLSTVFQQYLTTTKIPVFEYKINGDTLSYRWTNVVPGFKMPVKVLLSDSTYSFVTPSDAWQTAPLHLRDPNTFHVDQNFYVDMKRAN